MLTLTRAELREFTQRRRSDAQARVLDYLRLPYRVRPDGSLVVLRAVAEKALGGTMPVHQSEPELQP